MYHRLIHARHYGLLLAIGGAVGFSFKPIFIKLAFTYGITPETLMTLRMAFALPIYLWVGWRSIRDLTQGGNSIDRPALLKAMAVGIAGYYLASLLDLLGLQYTTAQFERMILFLYPTFVCLLGWLFFSQKISRRLLLSIPLSYCGIVLIFIHDFTHFGDDALHGALLVTSSAICFACYMLFSKSCISILGSAAFTCIAMVAASVVIVIHFLLTQPLTSLLVPWPALLLAFAVAIVSTVLPSFMISEAIARIGAGKTSGVGYLGPVVTSVMAVSLLGEAFTLYHLVGMGLVLFGVVYLSRE